MHTYIFTYIHTTLLTAEVEACYRHAVYFTDRVSHQNALACIGLVHLQYIHTYIHGHNVKKVNTPTGQANLPHDGRGGGVSRSLGLYQGQSKLRGIKRQAELLHLSLKRIL